LVVGLGGALVIWFVCAWALRQFDFTLWSALGLNLGVAALAIWATARLREASFPKAAIVPRAYDIPLRAAAVSAFVIIVTTISHSIGAFSSGVFAVFPIAMSSFIVILHNRIGGPATSNVIAHAQIPMLGLIPAFLAVYLLSATLGQWWALLIALMASLIWNAVLWTWRTQFAARLPME
jgi:hypothetical protein